MLGSPKMVKAGSNGCARKEIPPAWSTLFINTCGSKANAAKSCLIPKTNRWLFLRLTKPDREFLPPTKGELFSPRIDNNAVHPLPGYYDRWWSGHPDPHLQAINANILMRQACRLNNRYECGGFTIILMHVDDLWLKTGIIIPVKCSGGWFVATYFQ